MDERHDHISQDKKSATNLPSTEEVLQAHSVSYCLPALAVMLSGSVTLPACTGGQKQSILWSLQRSNRTTDNLMRVHAQEFLLHGYTKTQGVPVHNAWYTSRWSVPSKLSTEWPDHIHNAAISMACGDWEAVYSRGNQGNVSLHVVLCNYHYTLKMNT